MDIPALTTAQMREVDRLMVDTYHIGLRQMMENAGRGLAELARTILGGNVQGRPITVLCGPGNNGGGGMVAARHLHNWGARLNPVLAAKTERLKDVPAEQWSVLQALHLDPERFELRSSDLLVDALLGYGSAGDPRSPVREWIEQANASGVPILALDSPSGLDTTTGRPGQPCIRAEVTMTLALPKTGLLAERARDYVGRLYLADIGVPPELYRQLGIEVGSPFSEVPLVALEEPKDLRADQKGNPDG